MSYGSGIPIITGFDLGTAVPLDSRTKVDKYSDLASIPTAILYNGLKVYVEENDTEYKYKDGNWITDRIISSYGDIPLVNSGLGAAGTDDGRYARGDHIHPTDTTRASVQWVQSVQSNLTVQFTQGYQNLDKKINGDIVQAIQRVQGQLQSLDQKVTQDITQAISTLQTVKITGSNGLTGGGDLSQNRTIQHAVRITQGGTAVPAIDDASKSRVITQVNVDAYGHITQVYDRNLYAELTWDRLKALFNANGFTLTDGQLTASELYASNLVTYDSGNPVLVETEDDPVQARDPNSLVQVTWTQIVVLFNSHGFALNNGTLQATQFIADNLVTHTGTPGVSSLSIYEELYKKRT